jgi:Holliday junction resolvase
MKNGNRKGKAGEREFARLLRDHGWGEARRGQQYNGIDGQDVVGLPGCHVEVKRVERLNVDAAMAQAIRDAASDCALPIVAHRRNNKPWLVTMPAVDFLNLLRANDDIE